MKSLPLLLLFLLCIGTASAQPPEGEIAIDSGATVIAYASDILFDRIEVGMNRVAVANQAERMGWKVFRRKKNSIVFRKTAPEGMSGRMTIGFAANKARTAAVEFTAPNAYATAELATAMDEMRAAMLKRADDVDTKGTRTTFLHATTDGRLVRTVWNQVSNRKVTIEATVR